MQDFADLLDYIGILPFFPNPIWGFCAEEAVDPALLWGPLDGPWEWKGPLIRSGKCLYGKLFGSRAAYVAPWMYVHLANYRRDGYDWEGFCDDELAPYRDRLLMDYVSKRGPVLSLDAKKNCGFTKGFDTVLTRLQMQTFLTNYDFTYAIDQHGKPYGWGRAVLCAPEKILGEDRMNEISCSPADSLAFMVDHLHNCMGDVDKDLIAKLLK